MPVKHDKHLNAESTQVLHLAAQLSHVKIALFLKKPSPQLATHVVPKRKFGELQEVHVIADPEQVLQDESQLVHF